VLRNLTTVCRTHHVDAPGVTVEPDAECLLTEDEG
jgi:hypothetical protein